VKQYKKNKSVILGKIPNLDKDPALSDKAERANTEHPETDLKDEMHDGEPKQIPVQMFADTGQSYDQEENPPKTKKKRQN